MAHINLNGLVLAGGSSQRMGHDKAALVYHQKPQYQHIYDLLKPICAEVFISCKSDKGYTLPCIYDMANFAKMGPIAGLWSAFQKIPSAWLVLAIDYPFFSKADLQKLLLQRDTNLPATVYFQSENSFFEPFLGIYESAFIPILQAEIAQDNYSLQSILKNNDVKKVFPTNAHSLKSIDTWEDYQQTLLEMKK